MADTGTIRTIYEDSEKTKPIYPRTVLSAVSGITVEDWVVTYEDGSTETKEMVTKNA